MDCDVAGYHVDSFNYLADEGLHKAAIDVPSEKFRLVNGDAVEISYSGAQLFYPMLENVAATQGRGAMTSLDSVKLYPAECRMRGLTYRAKLRVTFNVLVNGRRLDLVEKVIGDVPVMLQSNRCNLFGLSRKQLVARGEEGIEKGGYFICKGSEKVVRLLVLMRRNYPVALVRNRFKEKGKLYSQYAVTMRCVKENHSATMMTLHYLDSGTMTVCVQFRRELFYIPLMYILKALTDLNDRRLYQELLRGREDDEFWNGCVGNMLHAAHDDGITNHDAALRALGNRFRVALSDRVGPWEPDEEVGRFLLQHCVAIHLSNAEEKLRLLTYMAQKLVALVKGECAPESPDNPQFQEAAISGHILLMVIREKLEAYLTTVRRNIEFAARRKGDTFMLTGQGLQRALGAKSADLSRALEYFLATGNLVTRTGLAMQQTTGFAVIAERINQLRFISHFRAIHRGAFFMEMRTTDVRKLRPEAWGFICPVHTPDGAPCGLLNHVTAACRIVTHYSDTKELLPVMAELGLITHSAYDLLPKGAHRYPVLVDGRFVGFVAEDQVTTMVRLLRKIKVNAMDKRVPYVSEITFVGRSPDPENIQTQYPGLFVFTEPARLIRPVRNLLANSIEYIGTFEQVYMSICIDPEEAEPGVTFHQEMAPNSLFSFSANLIPYPDHNQSPRNVYQCQMGKQTMGTPIQAWPYRADNKMYRIQTPQTPLLKPEAYDKYEMDEYPLGTNAIIAVVSYTGYDMEDAMVINKSSFQRGFAHGTVVKVERMNLTEKRDKHEIMMADPKKATLNQFMDADGLPIEGRMYREGDPYCCTYDLDSGTFHVHKFKSAEPAYCGGVRVLVDSGTDPIQHVIIQWRISRNPIIGDKFASRSGQKGINSFLWPVESLPFSETGIVPDIIFNPHGFPSRMTIGMMIEIMAGKGAAMHGWKQDATPFVFNEKQTAIEYFGDLLTKAGFNYYGNETMYSGIDGREFEVQIFLGIVYYQRLRHMIADKFQVRATGPIDPVTHQPVKGRKRAGGIRFGEMERDALIGHGAAFALQDRLLCCSDRDHAELCTRCGSLLSVQMMAKHDETARSGLADHTERQYCRSCGNHDAVQTVQVPRVFRYLTAELAAMNIKLQLHTAPFADAPRA